VKLSRLSFHIVILTGIALTVCAGAEALLASQAPSGSAAVKPVAVVNPALARLATRATSKSAWQSLRAYARHAQSPTARGLALLTLGYREYEAGDGRAARDLEQAAQTGFLLADYARFYQARALAEAGETESAARLLQSFGTEYPQSLLRNAAAAYMASLLLKLQRPQQALYQIAGLREATQNPAYLLLRAQAEEQLNNLDAAVKDYQEIYNVHPTAPEEAESGQALRRLRIAMGAGYAAAPDVLATRRAELLLQRGRLRSALKQYDYLIQTRSTSAWLDQWRVDRAACLVSLKRPSDAVASLTVLTPSSNAGLREARLAVLVRGYAAQNDEPRMLQTLQSLKQVNPYSASYAEALASVGFYYFRHANLTRAVEYYGTLAIGFADKPLGREAAWRVAWQPVIEKQPSAVRSQILQYLKTYPNTVHFPSALYWLGRAAEDQGSVAEARSYYKALTSRYVHNYFSNQASRRLARLKRSESQESDNPDPVKPVDLETPALPLPSPDLCSQEEANPQLAPFIALRDLHLITLAAGNLRLMAQQPSASASIYVVWANFDRQQKLTSSALFRAKQVAPDYPDYAFSVLPRDLWELLYPRDYWSTVQRQARANHIDPYLVMGLIRQESAFDPRATSDANARGLMQMLPETVNRRARGRYRKAIERRLFIPSYNIRLSCHYLGRLLRQYDGQVELALAAYNAGSNRVDEWTAGMHFGEPAEFVESIPFRDTRFYVEAVLRDAEVYRQLLGARPTFRQCLTPGSSVAAAKPAGPVAKQGAPKRRVRRTSER
jgi:soluble lytic murein transglycosylase